jgi:3-hydroxyanthranilate 3,4-dioxygenase
VVQRYELQLQSIVGDLPPTYERFYATTDEERRCSQCGEIHPGRDFKAWHEVLRAHQPTRDRA